MSERNLTSVSKFLSYLLRHHPEEIGLELDPHGWAEVNELVDKARNHGSVLSRELINRVIRHGDKTRFTLSEDGRYIRAGYGHSIDVDLELDPVAPPEHLYHGTARNNRFSIVETGIHPGNRNYVHLSADRNAAEEVGRRHGEPFIFQVRARDMYREGHPLYQSDSEPGIWLAVRVPADYIVPDSPLSETRD